MPSGLVVIAAVPAAGQLIRTRPITVEIMSLPEIGQYLCMVLMILVVKWIQI